MQWKFMTGVITRVADVNRPHDLESCADLISNRARAARCNVNEGGFESPSTRCMEASYSISSSSSSSSDSSSVLASENGDALFEEIVDEVLLTPAHRFALAPGAMSAMGQTTQLFTSLRQPHGGSRSGRSRNVERNFDDAARLIRLDWFWGMDEFNPKTKQFGPRYPKRIFERVWRMPRQCVDRIMDRLTAVNPFFQFRPNSCGVSAHPVQKFVAAFQMLTVGSSAQQTDLYAKIGESTAVMSLRQFCQSVVKEFGPDYLREPT